MPSSSRPFAVVSDSVNDDATGERSTGTVLLLGASGFLGRHISKRLDQLGISHIRIGHSHTTEVDGVIDLAESSQHDIDQLVAESRPTAVINAAGATRGSSVELTRGNVVAVHSLLMSVTHIAPTARLIQLGSSAEYGGAAHGHQMSEETDPAPGGAYGFTKLAASELVLQARRLGAAAAVLRIFNVSGPESPATTMLGRLVSELINSPEDAATITLDSLDGWRDIVDVRDVADAVCRAATQDSDVPPIINIGTGVAVQTGQWVRDLIAVSKPSARLVERAGLQDGHKASAGTVAWQCADINVARSSLGWKPQVSLQQSLADTWAARNDAVTN